MNKIDNTLEKLKEKKRNLQESGIENKEAGRIVFYNLISALNSSKLISEGDFDTEIDIEDEVLEEVKQNPFWIEKIYSKLVRSEDRRDTGQFFTPTEIAKFMSKLMGEDKSHILDPATGTGVFLQSSIHSAKKLSAVDKDALMIDAAKTRMEILGGGEEIRYYSEDFLSKFSHNSKYDGVIANPPYMDFHGFENGKEDFYRKYGVELGNLSNIYPYFFIKSVELLKDDGRLVFITPSEYLGTGYGIKLKRALKQFNIEAIISFEENVEVFDDALTTACITIVDKKEPKDKTKFISIDDKKQLEGIDSSLEVNEGIYTNIKKQENLNPEDKWTQYFEDIEYKRFLPKTVELSEIADVKRGIATGYNSFFKLSKDEVEERGIERKYLRKVLGKAKQAKNYKFNDEDFNILKNDGKKVYLLYIEDEPSESVQQYLDYGKEELEAHERYLTSNRDPWYKPEKREPADILATVFSRNNMRFVFNETESLNLASFHGIYTNFSELEQKAFCAYLNSDICLELTKIHKRKYGDGLDKFEPGDLEKIPVIDIRKLSDNHIKKLASLFDELDSSKRSKGNNIKERLNSNIIEIVETMDEKKKKKNLENFI